MIIRNSGSAGNIHSTEFFRPTEDSTGELCYSDTFQMQPVYSVTFEGFSLIVPYFYSDEQVDPEIEEFYSKFAETDNPLRLLEL